MSPPVERYIRCSVTCGDWIIEPGLEWREGDDFVFTTEFLRAVSSNVGWNWTGADPMRIAGVIGERIARSYPDRAFFVEVHDAALERWTQIYQPYGVPRSDAQSK